MTCQFDQHETLRRSRSWRVRLLHRIAQAIGLLIKIDGLPYGSPRRLRSRGWPGAPGVSGEAQSNGLPPLVREKPTAWKFPLLAEKIRTMDFPFTAAEAISVEQKLLAVLDTAIAAQSAPSRPLPPW